MADLLNVTLTIKEHESGMVFITSEGKVPIFIAAHTIEAAINKLPQIFLLNLEVANASSESP